MKRSLYSVKDREVDYVEGRSSNSSSNSSQCAVSHKEHSERLRQAINTSDLWNKFVKDNWAPVLESAFGPDWANKYPEEVTAILWWALNYRSRAHVGHAGSDGSNSNHSTISTHSSSSDTGVSFSLNSSGEDKGSTPNNSKFLFGLEQPPEFVIGCNTPTNRSTPKDTFHTPSSQSDQTVLATPATGFYTDAHCRPGVNSLKFPLSVTSSAGPIDMSALENALSHTSMADVGDIMQQIQQELESRIMLCDVSLDMGVNGDIDLPDLSPRELLERSGLAALLPNAGHLPAISNISTSQTPLPTASSPAAFTPQPVDDKTGLASEAQGSGSPHVVLIPTAPTLGLQQLAFSLSSSLSLMQDNLSEIATHYSPTAGTGTAGNTPAPVAGALQPENAAPSPNMASADDTCSSPSTEAGATSPRVHAAPSDTSADDEYRDQSNTQYVSMPQPCAESTSPQDEQPGSSDPASLSTSSPTPVQAVLPLGTQPVRQDHPSIAAPSATTFPSIPSLPNPFSPSSLTPPHSLFLSTPPTSSTASRAAPTPYTPTPISSPLPAFTAPIFASLNISSSSPAHTVSSNPLTTSTDRTFASLTPVPSPIPATPTNPLDTSSMDRPFTTLPATSLAPVIATPQPQSSGLPQFGLYIPALQSSSQQRSPDSPHTTPGTAQTGSAGFPSPATTVMLPTAMNSISGATSTTHGVPVPSERLCNVLYAMGNALALQYVPVQLVAAGSSQAGVAAAVPSGNSAAAVPAPPVYLMDSLVSGHTFQSIVDGVDSMGRAPLHVAAAAGRADVVEQLMYVGCDCSKPLQADFPLDQKLSHSGLQRLADIHTAAHNGEAIRGVVPGYEQPPSFVGCTALHLAAYFGNLEVVDLLLKAPGVDVKAVSACGMTALHMAANQGHAHVLSRLCKVPGAEVDAVDAMGCTALHHAAALGHAAVLDQLWPRGANLEALDPELRTPLHLAAQAGHTDVVSKLVIAGCHVQKYSKDGLTAGHLAAMYGYGDVLEKLLLAGYEVDCPTGSTLIPAISGATPLHLAAAAGHANVLSLLLSSGANIAKQDARGATALYYAVEGAQPAAFQMLLQAGSDVHVVDRQSATLLHAAAKGGNCEVIQSLLQLGCNVAACTLSAENVLHYAAKAGALEACKRLLECGADSSALDAAGNAPWHVAAMEGHHEVLELFLYHGVPLELPTLTGSTALHCAAAGGHVEAVQLLLDQGAASEATCTTQQQSALHVAARMNRLAVLQRLLCSMGKEAVNAQDVHGCTPLHYAAQKGNVEMLELLISSGADPNVGSKEGQTPLHLATKQQHLEAVECLLSHGCIAATCDVHGCNALHYAAQSAHLPLFQLLTLQPGTLVKEKARSGFTLLHYAVEGGSLEAVQMLLNAGVWEVDDYQGLEGHNNALHMACKLGKLEIVKVLLMAGYSATARGSEGRQPLHWAAFGSRLVPATARKGADYYGVLQLLLVSGVDVHAIDEHHCNAVMYAAGSGEVKVLEQLLQLGCNPLLQDMTGWTALHWAATGENGSVIPMLLQLGCPLGAVDQHGRMALHWAAEKGLMAAVTALVDAMLEAGLDVHMLDASGSSPAQLAACQGHVEVVAKLLETGKTKEVKGLTALHLAAQNGLDQVVAQLLAVAGCDVNVRDGDGLTPLHWAATRGALPVLQQLINGGADINAASNDGWMALHKAASAGHLAAVELLISCGSVINFKTSNGSTPLHYAASNGHTAVATQLIAAGCPVNAKSSAGCTALYCAASAGHLEAVEELLKANAEVDALTTTGCTALHIAASNGHAKAVQSLVAAGADMDIQASNGSCALHNAVQNGHVEVVEVLMAVGCDWDIQNSNGNTALHIAASKGNMDIVNKLLGAGCDVHIKNSKQWQAVHSAANNGYFDVVLRLVQHGAVWKSKGDADVVRMLVRKSSLKISYVEGRLRLAEREKQRLKKTPAQVAEHTVGSKPRMTGDELRQLSQQADANMAALLMEEEARREAQEAAAERRKAKKKSKKKKSTKEASTKSASSPSTEGEAEDADDEQGASDGRSLADEQQTANACQFDLDLGSDTPVEPEPPRSTTAKRQSRAAATISPTAAVAAAAAAPQSNGSETVTASLGPSRKKAAAAAAAATDKSTSSSGGEGKNSSLMHMIANLRINSSASSSHPSLSANSFKPGTSAPGQFGNAAKEYGARDQVSKSLPSAQAKEKTKQGANKDKAGSSKAQHAKPAPNIPLQPPVPVRSQQKAQPKHEAAVPRPEPQPKAVSEQQQPRSTTSSNKTPHSNGKHEVPPAPALAATTAKGGKAHSQRQQQSGPSQAAVATAAAVAAATAVVDTKKDRVGPATPERPHTAPAACTRNAPAPVTTGHHQRAKADDAIGKTSNRPVEALNAAGTSGSKGLGNKNITGNRHQQPVLHNTTATHAAASVDRLVVRAANSAEVTTSNSGSVGRSSDAHTVNAAASQAATAAVAAAVAAAAAAASSSSASTPAPPVEERTTGHDGPNSSRTAPAAAATVTSPVRTADTAGPSVSSGKVRRMADGGKQAVASHAAGNGAGAAVGLADVVTHTTLGHMKGKYAGKRDARAEVPAAPTAAMKAAVADGKVGNSTHRSAASTAGSTTVSHERHPVNPPKIDAGKSSTVGTAAAAVGIGSSKAVDLRVDTTTPSAQAVGRGLVSPDKRAVDNVPVVNKDSVADAGAVKAPTPTAAAAAAAASGTLSASAASFIPSSLSKARAVSSSAESASSSLTRSTRHDTAPPASQSQSVPLSYSAAVAPPAATRTLGFHRPNHLVPSSAPLSSSPVPPSALGAAPSSSHSLHAVKTAWGAVVAPPPPPPPIPSTAAAHTKANSNSPRTSSPAPKPAPPRPIPSLSSQASGRLSSSPSGSPSEPISHMVPPSVPLPAPVIPNSTAPTLNPWNTTPDPSELLARTVAATAAPWSMHPTLSQPITVGMLSRPMHTYMPSSGQALDWSSGVLPITSSRAAALTNRHPIDWSFAPSTSTLPLFPSSAAVSSALTSTPAEGGNNDSSAPDRKDSIGNAPLGTSSSPSHRNPGSSWQLQSHMLRSHSSSGLSAVSLMDPSVSTSLPTPIPTSSIWSFNSGNTGTGAFTRPVGAAGMIPSVARSLFNERGLAVGSLDSNSGSNSKRAVQFSTHVSDQYRCPISKKIMQDPVVAGDGYTYERAAIEEWLEKYDTSPITNGQFVSKELVPNMTMRAAIQLLATQ